jgi:hypothetical protein
MDEARDEAPPAETVQGPKGAPPDKDLTFDPEMTDADEANIPPASDADPNADEEASR